jgi:hypothetical protein
VGFPRQVPCAIHSNSSETNSIISSLLGRIPPISPPQVACVPRKESGPDPGAHPPRQYRCRRIGHGPNFGHTVWGLMADIEAPQSPEAHLLGGLLDADHPAIDLDRPSHMGTCDRCGFLMYSPPDEGLRHLPAPGEFSRVETWLEEHR